MLHGNTWHHSATHLLGCSKSCVVNMIQNIVVQQLCVDRRRESPITERSRASVRSSCTFGDGCYMNVFKSLLLGGCSYLRFHIASIRVFKSSMGLQCSAPLSHETWHERHLPLPTGIGVRSHGSQQFTLLHTTFVVVPTASAVLSLMLRSCCMIEIECKAPDRAQLFEHSSTRSQL